ncbi:hypothetical protein ACN27G_35160 [Plantactinospora sp. WMMB334]|uniref:hypothetical protein n=1 Tax=Plantactinospora sp. WMMB334 TaxID=3404119 RepID=UPI003B930B62
MLGRNESIHRSPVFSTNNLMKLTIYLVGDVDMDRLRAELARWLGHQKPTPSILFVAGLVGPSFRVQVDALAAL